MGKEFELKYAATSQQLAMIRAALAEPPQTVEMQTTYYDTPDGALSARKWTLRRRLENGVSVCTLKTPGTGHSRNEWELECSCIDDSISELCKLSDLSELCELTKNGIIPICGARFTRRASLQILEDATVELALDEGRLFGGNRELPFAELEVELKSGSEQAATAYAQALADRFGLQPEAKSKFRRALALAKGE